MNPTNLESIYALFAVAVASILDVHAFVVPRYPSASACASHRARQHLHAISINDLNSGSINVASKVHPSVALVIPIGVRNMTSRGSGFVIDGKEFNLDEPNLSTYLITAAHVAAPGYDIELTFGTDKTIAAVVVHRNQTLDLALLKINKDAERAPLSISKDLPPTGTLTFAHGYPASKLRGPAMTSGIVCGIADGLGLPETTTSTSAAPPTAFDPNGNILQSNNDTTIFVCTDAGMSGGMSGGPLTNIEGNVVGVNALIRPDLRALGNYAVSSEEVLSFLKSVPTKLDDINNINNTTARMAYQVILYNDRMNKKERVAKILKNIAQLDKVDANKVMMDAHTTGRGVICAFDNKDEANQLWMDLRKEDLLVEVLINR